MSAFQITICFWVAIGLVVVVGLYFRLIKKQTNKVIALLPNIAVSAGILGTFVGIYIGLLEFNENNISDSIPKLLGV